MYILLLLGRQEKVNGTACPRVKEHLLKPEVTDAETQKRIEKLVDGRLDAALEKKGHALVWRPH
jgi:hypothetical protein